MAGESDDECVIVLLVFRQLVGLNVRDKFDPGPLAPEIDAGGCFDQFHDVCAAHASSGFEKVDAAVVVSFDEFGVGHSTLHAQCADDLPVHFFQDRLVLESAGNCTSGKDAALVIHIQGWASIMMSFGEDYLAVEDKRIDMVDITGDVAL